jgi:hypothetical protein
VNGAARAPIFTRMILGGTPATLVAASTYRELPFQIGIH